MSDGNTYVEYDDGQHGLYNNLSDAAQLRNSYLQASPPTKVRLANWMGSLKIASGAALRLAPAGPRRVPEWSFDEVLQVKA